MATAAYIRESVKGHEMVTDVYTKLMGERIIFIDGEITDDLASLVISDLLYLESADKEKDISIYINSPGGSVTAGLAILDVMDLIEPDIVTVCIGVAASMAAVILSAGTKGKRYALPRSEMLIHQPVGGAVGQTTDVKIQVERMLGKREMLNSILAENTGQDIEKIARDTDRDYYMSTKEAIEYGLIDSVLTRK